jgi:hypothetical protein
MNLRKSIQREAAMRRRAERRARILAAIAVILTGIAVSLLALAALGRYGMRVAGCEANDLLTKDRDREVVASRLAASQETPAARERKPGEEDTGPVNGRSSASATDGGGGKTCATTTEAGPSLSPSTAVQHLLAAIWMVESSRREDSPDADLDSPGGPSIGPLKITRAYWIDSGVSGCWEDCRRLEYAERVVLAYWDCYGPDALAAGDLETLARIHKGGPRGREKARTLDYWRRVRVHLEERS